MKDLTFEVKENGKMVKYEIIIYFNHNNKNYVVYKEPNKDDIYASTYDIKDNELILGEIETDEEWDYIDKVLEEDYNE